LLVTVAATSGRLMPGVISSVIAWARSNGATPENGLSKREAASLSPGTHTL
jgi:hypothetical protein